MPMPLPKKLQREYPKQGWRQGFRDIGLQPMNHWQDANATTKEAAAKVSQARVAAGVSRHRPPADESLARCQCHYQRSCSESIPSKGGGRGFETSASSR